MLNKSKLVENKEIVLVMETIANAKRIKLEQVYEALKNTIVSSAKKTFGSHLNISCDFDSKSGEMKTYNLLEVVDEEFPEFNPDIHILSSNKDVFLENDDTKYLSDNGKFIYCLLPNISLNRSIIADAVFELKNITDSYEKENEYKEFENRVGTVVMATVAKIPTQNVINHKLMIEGHEAIINIKNLIPGERIEANRTIKVYIEEVRREDIGAQIFVSRTHKNFVRELLRQNIPEISDDIIKIHAIARIPGVKTKVAVSSDTIDPLSAILGVQGNRIKAIQEEIGSESIDVVRWSPNIAEFAINLFKKEEIEKVVLNEDEDEVDIVVRAENLGNIIGKNGYKVKLASLILGINVNIMSVEEEKEVREAEKIEAVDSFIQALDIDEMISKLLVNSGYMSISDVANTSISELCKIEGFDEEISQELKTRSWDFLNN